MKDDEYVKFLEDGYQSAVEREQSFYLRYSAGGLGLLMTLQAWRNPATGEVAGGPVGCWIAAMLCFLGCFALCGIDFWLDRKNHAAFLIDYRKTGKFKLHPGWKMALIVNGILVKALFFGALASAVLFFILPLV